MAQETISNIDSNFLNILSDSISAGLAGVHVMGQTGAVELKTGLRAKLGTQVVIPQFSALSEFADVSTDGTPITPVALSVGKNTATVVQSANATDITDFAEKSLPSIEEAKRQLLEGAQRRFNLECINAAVAAEAGMTIDIWNSTTPAYLDNTLISDGLAKLGDEEDQIAGFVIHSATKQRLRKLLDSTNRPLFNDPVGGGVATLFGYPVFVSDLMPVATGKYTSLILKKNSIGLWINENPAVESQRNVLSASTVLATHIYFAACKYSKMNGKSKSGVVILKHNS